MKIDFTQTLKTLSGKPIQADDGKGKQTDLLLSAICTNALLNALQGPDGRPERQTGEDKLKQWKLAEKIYEAKDVELKAEEIALIKGRVGKLYDTSIVGPAYQLLEQK